jgi:hypothetical protein
MNDLQKNFGKSQQLPPLPQQYQLSNMQSPKLQNEKHSNNNSGLKNDSSTLQQQLQRIQQQKQQQQYQNYQQLQETPEFSSTDLQKNYQKSPPKYVPPPV